MAEATTPLPLQGLKVLDVGTIVAAPLIATFMADFGADVVKVEHPKNADHIRRNSPSKNGVPLWWKIIARNKQLATLDLSKEQGQELFRELIRDTDVLVENFRPGTLERWNLGWDMLHAVNPRLVMVRVSGYGQTGPHSHRAGFGTLAEAMSGFAHVTGQTDGPPTLPPFALADSVAALFGTFAAMFAIYHRDQGGSGVGQCIDLSLFEPLFFILGAQSTLYDQLGLIQNRFGNRVPSNAPRDAYQTSDGRWVALSTGSPNIAMRVLRLTGGDAAANDPRFATPQSRIEHREEVESLVADWIRARPLEEVVRAFEEVGAAIAPVYDIAQIFQDVQYQARPSIITVEDPDLGPIRMPNVFPFLSKTPGRVRFPGATQPGAHNQLIFVDRLGHAEAELEQWRRDGVI